MLNGMAVNFLGAVRTRCGALINSKKGTKTVSINHSCRHFRMKVRLNLVSLVFNRLCKELTKLSIAPTLSSNKKRDSLSYFLQLLLDAFHVTCKVALS